MRQSAVEQIGQQRTLRKDWVNEQLKKAGRGYADPAVACKINPRTWREWVHKGTFPAAKQADVVFILFNEEDLKEAAMLARIEEISGYFEWI